MTAIRHDSAEQERGLVSWLAPTLAFLAGTLAAYLGVVYVFSFSQSVGSGRHAIHLAILLMNMVILERHVRARLGSSEGPVHGSSPDWRSLLLRVLVFGSLGLVVLLHVDYGVAKYRGAEEGWAGSLLATKTYILLTQLIHVVFMLLWGAVRSSQRMAGVLARPQKEEVLVFSIVLVPLVSYLAHNPEIFTIVTAVEYLAFFVAAPFAFFLLARFLQCALRAIPAAAPVTASLALVYYSMPLVSSWLKRPVEELFAAHLGLAVLVPVAVAALYQADRRSTARALVLITACSIGGTITHAVAAGDAGAEDGRAASAVTAGPASEASELTEALAGPVTSRPDVYLLVYDGYAPQSMLPYYGIGDDSDGEYLNANGFTIYDTVYSIFLWSRPSMGSLLDMRLAPRAGIGGATTATEFLRATGYQIHLVLNAYLLSGSAPIVADFVFPSWEYRSGLSALYRGIAGGEFKPEIVFQDSVRDEWLAAKRSVLTARDGPPRMLYAHSGYPGHSQNSGSCRADEIELYADRLAVARQEMRSDVEAILSSERDAIIIVAGDHGPNLTGDCLYLARHRPEDLTAMDLADRYGARLAIRWPTAVPETRDRIRILQDVPFAVAAYLLGDDRIWQHRLPAETVGYGGIPHGAVKDGTVMLGRDKGRPLLAP